MTLKGFAAGDREQAMEEKKIVAEMPVPSLRVIHVNDVYELDYLPRSCHTFPPVTRPFNDCCSSLPGTLPAWSYERSLTAEKLQGV